MPRNYFTDEQIEELSKNKYVLKVSKANIVFTDEFKITFLELLNSGDTPIVALTKLNIDPKVLGRRRIRGLAERIRKFSKRSEGFSRKKNSSAGKPRKKKVPSFENDKQALEYYKEYASKLEQELEFVKKFRLWKSNTDCPEPKIRSNL